MKQRYVNAARLLTLGLLLNMMLVAASQANEDRRCFTETGHCIEGRMLAFWQQNGGLPVFGFPITPQRSETVEGQPVQVQWFERNRLELHPQNKAPYDVLIGRLGADLLSQDDRDWFQFPKSAPKAGCRFFAETGHQVCGEFLQAWRASGLEFDGRRGVSEPESLALFGLPLSDAQQETVDGKQRTVQWFERARFELHPQNQPPYNVLLGLLGRQLESAACGVPVPAGRGLWVSREELARLPQAGPAWAQLRSVANGGLGRANISDQDNNHDVRTLAVALVWARTNDSQYRAKAADAIMAAVGTEDGDRTLALGRNLVSYIVAADLIDFRSFDPVREQQFRAWLSAVRWKNLAGRTLISTHEDRPNNWGTHAGAARIAAAIYLDDRVDLERAATVFRGWLGDRGAYAGFLYEGDLSWQADPNNPVGINPPGATRDSRPIGGAIPDDMRRGGTFQWPPVPTNYPWGALEGAVVQAELLSRAGYDAWNWSDRAVLRAAEFLYATDQELGGWWATGDDEWMPWIINRNYGTNFPAARPAQPGKNLGWTDWVYGCR